MTRKKYTIDDVIEFVKAKGGECLSKEYINSVTPMEFKCDKGHAWKAGFVYLKSGNWCPECHGERKRYNFSDLEKYASLNKGKILSKTYIDSNKKYKWECENGHKFYRDLFTVTKGFWCNECDNECKLEEIKEIAFDKEGELLSQKYTNTRDVYVWKCKNEHIFTKVLAEVKRGAWCTECVGLMKMEELAEMLGGECLSNKYIDTKALYKWKCEKGHIFKKSLNSALHQGKKWCNQCNKIERENKKKNKMSNKRRK